MEDTFLVVERRPRARRRIRCVIQEGGDGVPLGNAVAKVVKLGVCDKEWRRWMHCTAIGNRHKVPGLTKVSDNGDKVAVWVAKALHLPRAYA